MKFGKNINLFLIDSEETGRIKCTLSNWTGEIYKIPRKKLEESKSRKELNYTGVYILIGKDENEKDTVYIGQGNLRKNGKGVLGRIFEHLRDSSKDFFNDTIIVTTSNDIFGPTEVSYLENKLTNIAIDANRYNIINGNDPNIGNITEEKKSELDEFIEYTKLIIGSLGYKIFVPLLENTKNTIEHLKEQIEEDKEIYFLKRGTARSNVKINGYMKITNEGFVVLKGSVMEIIDSNNLSNNEIERRKNAKKTKEGVLLEDMLFTSPSSAATFLIGSRANGHTEWKDEKGRTYKEVNKLEI